MASNNPFSPSFGVSPPTLVGRDDILNAIDEALATGPTHPDYTSLLIGYRGVGKTVVLNAVEDLASGRGWLIISENAHPTGLLARLTRSALDLLNDHTDPDPTRRLKGLKAAGVGIDFELTKLDEPVHDLRNALSALGSLLREQETGVLITIDELHAGNIDELREFGSILQHVSRREQNPIAFVAAALPLLNDTLLADDTVTFLQRCARYEVGRLSPTDTFQALKAPIANRNGNVSERSLAQMVKATSGYAFMVQLVGFHVWKAAKDTAKGIKTGEVSTGINEAEQRIGPLVHAPIWKDLSPMDKKVLVAMTHDDEDSELSEIGERIGKNGQYVSVYRHRLIKTGMVESSGVGRIRFVHRSAQSWIAQQHARTL